MIKHCTQTVRATEPRLVLNCRFFQVVFRPLVVFCFEHRKSTVEPHYNGTEGTDCIFALLPKSGVASWAISVRKKAEKSKENKTIFWFLLLARYPIV